MTSYHGETTVTVRGPETKATLLHYQRRDVAWLGIRFKPGAFLPALPPGMLRDRRDVDLPLAARRSVWLHGAAWEVPTFENADTFVERLVRAGLLVRDPIVQAVLRGEPQAMSPRALQYRFMRATGLTQKTIQQIARARHAQALLAQGISILDTVHATGYFDQAHLTNALKRFLSPAHAPSATRYS